MNGSSTRETVYPRCHKPIHSQATLFWKGGSNKTTICTPSVGSRSSTGVVDRSQLLWFVCLLRACQTKRSKHSYGFFFVFFVRAIRWDYIVCIISLNSFLVGHCKIIRDSLYTWKVHHNIFTVIKKDIRTECILCCLLIYGFGRRFENYVPQRTVKINFMSVVQRN